MSNQQGPNAVNLRWEAAQKRKEWKKEDAAMNQDEAEAYAQWQEERAKGDEAAAAEAAAMEAEAQAAAEAWEKMTPEERERLRAEQPDQDLPF